MTEKISASWSALLDQAHLTASSYFVSAVRVIDKQFGDGYAARHPELIVGFMEVSARDLSAMSNAVGLQWIAQAIEERGVE